MRERIQVRGTAGSACPLCREPLEPDGEERLHDCPGCETRFHLACAHELGGCSTLGCRDMGRAIDAPLREAEKQLAAERRQALALAARREAEGHSTGPPKRRALPVCGLCVGVAVTLAGMAITPTTVGIKVFSVGVFIAAVSAFILVTFDGPTARD